MVEGENEFVKRRIYLTLEHGRNIALRNLLRKVFVAGGFIEAKEGEAPVRRTRIPVDEFAAAMRLSSGQNLDTEEVECLLANMIYKVRRSSFASTVPLPHPPLPACQPRGCLAAPRPEGSDDVHRTGRKVGTMTNCAGLPQNLMKGYIAHERGIVVLSKNGAFPGTGV